MIKQMVCIRKWRIIFLTISFLVLLACNNERQEKKVPTDKIKSESKRPPVLDSINNHPIVAHICSPDDIRFFLKDENGNYFNKHGNLKKHLEAKGQQLRFAMNGGMYLEDFSPQGLYIENGNRVTVLNTKHSNYGNFYMQPNGVFYIDEKNEGHIVKTTSYQPKVQVKYATQSGPMLVINGHLHPKFVKNSKYVHIRNGVGIMSNGDLLFAMSYKPITFYDFASYFKQKGCKDALYLDGAISKTYLPEKGIEQVNGRFGVIIAEVKEKRGG